jgi:hypothetical protein
MQSAGRFTVKSLGSSIEDFYFSVPDVGINRVPARRNSAWRRNRHGSMQPKREYGALREADRPVDRFGDEQGRRVLFRS